MAEEIDSPRHDIAASVDPSAGDLDQPASSAGTLDAVASAGMPGLVLRTAHHNARTLLRAWNDVASAVMAAELEQFDLVRSFYDNANHDWDQWQNGQIADSANATARCSSSEEAEFHCARLRRHCRQSWLRHSMEQLHPW